MTGQPVHATRIRVRGYHLDLYGHVNNARYLEFLEEARWGFIESARGLEWWHDQGLGFVVASITINYRRPAGLGTDLEVRSTVARLGGRSAVIHQDVVDTGSGELVADADVTFVVVSLETGRPVALAGELRAALGGEAAP
ncbi:MAG: acyl-CoA thioesterase [Candidatus Krumholzibacteriia bacterium]